MHTTLDRDSQNMHGSYSSSGAVQERMYLKMKEVEGDIWEMEGLKCILTNCLVREGRLIMGAGIAKECKDRYPEIDKSWGFLVHKYGACTIFEKRSKLVIFPTKINPSEMSSLALIKSSALRLRSLWETGALDEYETILLPRPGCGLGGLDWNTQVKPALEPLLEDMPVVIVRRKGEPL